ncbi:DUF1775 domain-containing protein [Enterovirga aerilata]|uniref:DUF1775 domain-containing protein n=1 Tax=Enterovirga aerilata TaxID=2730920 RepID=A0A849I1G8_9HYPH|nr:DUF1775 domain-containing protein [Enterovirga sp. DB1703]NNM73626.1 DUF1775 domain-containing protein [Enterovirga sp. DB1703]
MNSSLLRGAACAAAIAAISSAAHAHATLAVREAAPNSTYRAVIQINHGCDGSPTTAVRVTVPDGVIAARPMPKPGWTLATTKGPYPKAYPHFHGKTLAEGVREIAWSGGPLADEHYDEFVFVARITDDFAPGETLRFPVVQECEAGAHRWVDVPAPGGDQHALKSPAPAVRIVQAAAPAAPAQGAASHGTVLRAGALVIESPWTRATPGGAKVAGGYLRVTNTGTEPDRLVGASAEIAGRGEVHEMSTENGVMKMRELAGGIEIRPGQTVELKPGGLHLMFMDLKAALKEGDTIRGTLVFEKAGTVAVTFRVGGLGARAAPEHHDH